MINILLSFLYKLYNKKSNIDINDSYLRFENYFGKCYIHMIYTNYIIITFILAVIFKKGEKDG
ncbi:hypothetical protein TL18_08410 [Methanobrevibacter sp. YE315]|nr:hypothetical protein TL18_08410 [Methanobrevibacter sp. YE315]